MHNGALPIHENHIEDVPFSCERGDPVGYVEWKYCDDSNKLAMVAGKEVGSQIRRDDDGIVVGDCTQE